MEVRRISPTILSVHLIHSRKVVTFISVYGPQSGRNEGDKDSKIKRWKLHFIEGF